MTQALSGHAFRRLVASLPLVLMLSAAAPAAAQGPTEATRAEAAQRYKRGHELYAEENFGAALVEFRKSYELTSEFRVLFNIGQVCFQMQDYVCALEAFERYLKEGGPAVTAQRQQEVAADLEKLRSRVGQVRITASVDGAAVAVDEVARGTTPLAAPLPLNAGRHRISVTKLGKVPVTRIIELAGAEAQEFNAELVDDRVAPVVVRERVKESAPSRWTTLSYVGLGASAALAVGAGITGIMALDASNQVRSANYYQNPTAEDRANQNRAQTLSVTTDILLAASAVTLGTTLVLTLTRKLPAEEPARRAGVRLGAGYAAAYGEF